MWHFLFFISHTPDVKVFQVVESSLTAQLISLFLSLRVEAGKPGALESAGACSGPAWAVATDGRYPFPLNLVHLLFILYYFLPCFFVCLHLCFVVAKD